MKKYVLIFIACLFLVSCTRMSQFYQHEQDGNQEIFYNDKSNEAFVGKYSWNFDLNNTTINISDEYNDCLVTGIGGYHGTGVSSSFTIDINEDSYYACFRENVTEFSLSDYEVVEIVFNITIGKNINKITKVEKNQDYYILHEGDTVCYKITLDMKCSEENKTFYAKDGKLYYRDSDTLVEEFVWE